MSQPLWQICQTIGDVAEYNRAAAQTLDTMVRHHADDVRSLTVGQLLDLIETHDALYHTCGGIARRRGSGD